jgi:hypothetical protein
MEPVTCRDIDGRFALPIPAGFFAVGLVAILFYLLARVALRCALQGCTVPLHAARIPWPGAWTNRARTDHRLYMVYEIYAVKPGAPTYKYGITQQLGGVRPTSQLPACRAYFKSACLWKPKRLFVNGFYWARIWEASYIGYYASRHGHCPPGQLTSCI